MSQAESALEIVPATHCESGEHEVHTQATRRLVPFRLEVASPGQDDEEDTLVVSAKDSKKMVARAFSDLECAELAPDSVANEAPASVPPEAATAPEPLDSGTRKVAERVSEVPEEASSFPDPVDEAPATADAPSDEAVAPKDAETEAEEGFASLSAFDAAFASAFPAAEDTSSAPATESSAVPPELSNVLSYAPVPDISVLMAPEVLRAGSSLGLGNRTTLTPEEKQAARASREAARRARAAATWMRVVVVGIWGTAVVLAVLLALFARIGS